MPVPQLFWGVYMDKVKKYRKRREGKRKKVGKVIEWFKVRDIVVLGEDRKKYKEKRREGKERNSGFLCQ